MEKGGQWRLALRAYEQMRRRGCKADAIVYNAVVNALWETGIVWAQRISLRLFKTALTEGHFPQQSLTPGLIRAEVNLHATTSGVAMLSLYVWLLNLKEFATQYGYAAAPAKVTIVTDRGRGAREQGNLIVKESVNAMMTRWKAPFSPSPQRNATSPTLEANGPALAQWVLSPEFNDKVFSFFPCSDQIPRDSNDNRRPEDSISDAVTMLDDPGHHKETSVEERCAAAFAAVKHFEKTHSLVVHNMGYQYLQKRSALIQNCLTMNSKLGAQEECGHDAVLLMDRVMSSSLSFAPEIFDLLAAACVTLSYDQLDNATPKLDSDQLERATGQPSWAVRQMEISIRQLLSNDTSAISTIRCVKLLLERLGCQHLKKAAAEAISGDVLSLCTACICDTAFLNCRPSIIASAVVYTDRRTRGVIPFWPSALAKLTGYNDVSALELSVAIKTAHRICGSRAQQKEEASIAGSECSKQSSVISLSSLERESSISSVQQVLEVDYSLPVADITPATQQVLQTLQEVAATYNDPTSLKETDDSAKFPSSSDQSTSAFPSNNNSSGTSSDDGQAGDQTQTLGN